MLRPVAGVALSIGLVMAVVGLGMPGMQPATDFASDEANRTAPAGAAFTDSPELVVGADDLTAPPDIEGKGGDEPRAAATASPTQRLDSASAASPDRDTTAPRQELRPSTPVDTTRDLLVYGGLAIALLASALLALAVIGRRFFADPLLR